MQANQILLQRKYARIMEKYAQKSKLSLNHVLDLFYNSELYQEMSEGISDMHCRSDDYLVEELEIEFNLKNNKD